MSCRQAIRGTLNFFGVSALSFSLLFLFLFSVAACTPAPEITTESSVDRIRDKSSIECVRGGCSNTVCLRAPADQLITSCEWKPEYACYKMMECAPTPQGECKFAETEESKKCFANPPKE
jgi:hypothetical protein